MSLWYTWETFWEEEAQHYSNKSNPFSNLTTAQPSKLSRNSIKIQAKKHNSSIQDDAYLKKLNNIEGRLKKM